MFMRSIVAGLVIMAIIVLARIVTAQPGRNRPRLAIEHVADKARAATVRRPESVRDFVNEIFARSPFAQVSPSIVERFSRADLAFRNGQLPGVSEEDFLRAVDAIPFPPGTPDFVRTTREQTHLFRELARTLVPDFDSPELSPHGFTETMSPAEAAFVLVNLATQKMSNPEYQVPPARWGAEVRERRSRWRRRPPAQQGPRLEVRAMSVDQSAIHALFNVDLTDDSTDVNQEAHALLDRLGLPR